MKKVDKKGEKGYNEIKMWKDESKWDLNMNINE